MRTRPPPAAFPGPLVIEAMIYDNLPGLPADRRLYVVMLTAKMSATGGLLGRLRGLHWQGMSPSFVYDCTNAGPQARPFAKKPVFTKDNVLVAFLLSGNKVLLDETPVAKEPQSVEGECNIIAVVPAEDRHQCLQDQRHQDENDLCQQASSSAAQESDAVARGPAP